jgi:MYXO-CTERM domain-containing protein
MIELTTDVAPTGDTVNDEFVVLSAKVTGGGEAIRFVKNGTPLEETPITGDFLYQKVFDAPATGEDRYRAEVLVDGKPRTITSHVFVKRAVTGRPRPVLDAPSEESKGCGCNVGGAPRAGAFLALVGLAALLLRRRVG